MTFNPLL